MSNNEQVIAQTKKWITDVVVALNFCPFAAKEVKQNTIHYQVENSTDIKICVGTFLNECGRMDEQPNIETTMLIFPNGFEIFDDYLDLVDLAEKALKRSGMEGIYQVASFHPLYCFAGSTEDDAANYTNRSVYPMLHLIREESIEAALKNYANPGQIPERNVDFAREKGIVYMKMLRDNCY